MKRQCKGTTKKGKPCAANPREDTGYCNAHSPKEVQESSGFGGAQPGAGRPRAPRAVDVLRERMEKDIDRVLAPLFDGLEANRGLALMVKGGGMEIAMLPDHETRIRAARELLDRAYGRPKQATEISGPEGGPIATVPISIPDTDAYRARVAELAASALGVTASPFGDGDG